MTGYPNPAAIAWEGYHQFRDELDEPYGSFLVYWNDLGASEHAGWCWVAEFPGCLPDGEPSGPFSNSREAYDDAQSRG